MYRNKQETKKKRRFKKQNDEKYRKIKKRQYSQFFITFKDIK